MKAPDPKRWQPEDSVVIQRKLEMQGLKMDTKPMEAAALCPEFDNRFEAAQWRNILKREKDKYALQMQMRGIDPYVGIVPEGGDTLPRVGVSNDGSAAVVSMRHAAGSGAPCFPKSRSAKMMGGNFKGKKGDLSSSIMSDDDDDEKPRAKKPFRSTYIGATAAGLAGTGVDTDAAVTGGERDVLKCSNTAGDGVFMPHHVTAEFCERNNRGYVVIGISIPSGVLYEGNLTGRFQAKVDKDGLNLIVRCEWPEKLSCSNTLAKSLRTIIDKAIDDDMAIFSMVTAFDQTMASIRKKIGVTRNKMIGGSAKIPLPRECENSRLGLTCIEDNSTGAGIVYILLKAVMHEEHDSDNSDDDLMVKKIGSSSTSSKKFKGTSTSRRKSHSNHQYDSDTTCTESTSMNTSTPRRNIWEK